MLTRFRTLRQLRQLVETSLKDIETEAAADAWNAGTTWADLGAADLPPERDKHPPQTLHTLHY